VPTILSEKFIYINKPENKNNILINAGLKSSKASSNKFFFFLAAAVFFEININILKLLLSLILYLTELSPSPA